jgi:uncharacterized protein (DUF302 family)
MHYLSKYVAMSFQDALVATKEALRRNQFAILAEIDMRKAFRRHLGLEFRPYVIVATCRPQLAERAIEDDDEIGSILLCNLVVQQQKNGGIKISVADPCATIGATNHVDLISIARELRSRVQQAIDDIEPVQKFPGALSDREEPNHELARALPQNRVGDPVRSEASARAFD